MAMTAMAALKELVDSEDFLRTISSTSAPIAYGAYFQKPPDDIDLSTGDIFMFDFQGEEWSYTTESILKALTCSVISYCNSFERCDQVVGPALEDLLEDAEQSISIAGHDSYNLEITRKMLALTDQEDRLGNPVYMVEFGLKLDYQRPRKGSLDAVNN